MRLLILRHRQTPCKQHRRFNDSRMYLCLLLLLMAGDIELNPGPAQVETCEGNGTPQQTADSETVCISCGLQSDRFTLRSRPIKDTVIRCSEGTCTQFIHDQCCSKPTTSQHIHWRCQAHARKGNDLVNDLALTATSLAFTKKHEPGTISVEQPVEKNTPESPEYQLPDHHHPQSSQSSDPLDLPGSVFEGTPVGRRPPPDPPGCNRSNRQLSPEPPEPLPGPSFISVSLMDVMEAVRLIQLKMDNLTEEVSQLKRLLQTVQQVQGSQPSRSTATGRLLNMSPGEPGESPNQEVRCPTSEPRLSGQQDIGRPSLLVIGDSNVRHIRNASSRSADNLAFHSISGATTDQVRRDIAQVVTETSPSQVVLHVGTNDITRNGSEVVVKNILNLVQQAKGCSGVGQVYVCSIVPRRDRGAYLFSRSESVNNRLRTLCSKLNGVSFVDLRQRLESCPFSGLLRDAVHYNRMGSVQAYRMITESTGYFLV